MATTGDRTLAVWLTVGDGYGERGPLIAAHSANRGITWNLLPSPADDGGNGDHAYIDLVATPDSSFHAVWLDNRYGLAKGLRYAQLLKGEQKWLPNVTIDPETCECCWTTIRSDSQGTLFVLYRDKNPRDMALAVSSDNGATWKIAGAVRDFQWDFDGCPHVGGGLAVEETETYTRLHSVVWSGSESRRGLTYLRADTDDLKWSAPKTVGSPLARHADIAVDSTGNVYIAWTEFTPHGTTLFTSQYIAIRNIWTYPKKIPSRNPSHPRLAKVGNQVSLFWTEEKNSDIRHIFLHRTVF